MTRRPSHLMRLTLGLLALWLSLWPAGDAVSGSSLTMVMPDEAPPPCCSDQAPAKPACPAASRNGCDTMAKQCNCLLLGGLAFHCAGCVTVEPQTPARELPRPPAVFAPTREPEPPEHPPTAPA